MKDQRRAVRGAKIQERGFGRAACGLVGGLILGTAVQASWAQETPERFQRESYLAHIAAANSALRLHAAGDAKRWLRAAPGDHTAWEWRFLNARSDSASALMETGEWQPVRCEYSPDGSRLVVAGSDGRVRIFDSQTREMRLQWEASAQTLYAARYSPDGTRIATCARDGQLALWNADTGDLIWSARNGGEGLADISFDPRGDRLLFSSWYRGPETVLGLVALWDVAKGSESWRTIFGVKPIVAARFSSDGERFAVGTWDAKVGLWNSRDLSAAPQELNFADLVNYSAIDDIAFSPDGLRLAAASKSGAPRIWDLAEGRLRQELHGHANAVFSVAYGNDSSRILTAGSDGVIQIWDAESGVSLQKLFGHDSRIGSIALRPDGRQLASCSADKTIRFWDLDLKGRFSESERSKYIYGMAISGDGQYLALGGMSDTDVYVFDLATGQLKHRIPGPTGSINFLDFGPDHLLAGGNWAGEVRIWDAAQGSEVSRFQDPDGAGLTQCAFSPDGKWLAVATNKQRAVVYDRARGEIAARLDGGGWSVQFSPDGTRLCTGADSGLLKAYSAGDWKEQWSVTGPRSAVRDLAFAPDGATLAAVYESGEAGWFDAIRGLERIRIQAHSERVWTAAYLQGGGLLVTGGADRQLKFWDPIRGELVLTNSDANEVIYNLAPVPNTDSVVVNSSGMQIFVLTAPPIPAVSPSDQR